MGLFKKKSGDEKEITKSPAVENDKEITVKSSKKTSEKIVKDIERGEETGTQWSKVIAIVIFTAVALFLVYKIFRYRSRQRTIQSDMRKMKVKPVEIKEEVRDE